MNWYVSKQAVVFENEEEIYSQCDYKDCNNNNQFNRNLIIATNNENDLNENGDIKKYCQIHGFYCYDCDNFFGKKDAKYENNNGKYCYNCAKLSKCRECGNRVLDEELIQTEDYGLRCEDCVKQCEKCEQYYSELNNINIDGQYQYYCDDCMPPSLFECDKCNNYFTDSSTGRLVLDENGDIEKFLCHKCGISKCVKCGLKIPANKFNAIAEDFYGTIYCDKCYAEQRLVPEEFEDEKNLPLSNNYEFNVEFSGWAHSLQRMKQNPHSPQLVLNITHDPSFLSKEADLVIKSINRHFNKEGHPFKPNQIGWVRMELGESVNDSINLKQLNLFEQPIEQKEEKFLLVEEIQSDLDNFLYNLKNNNINFDKQFKDIKDLLNKKVIRELKRLAIKFPDLAMSAIFKFAKQYNYSTLYYHSFNNKTRQGANPPKSFYTTLPEQYGFEPTEKRPFDFPGQYLSRKAKLKWLLLKSGGWLINQNLFANGMSQR